MLRFEVLLMSVTQLKDGGRLVNMAVGMRVVREGI